MIRRPPQTRATSWQQGLCAALLAVLLQVMAPIWAMQAVASQADPFANAPICYANGHITPSQGDSGQHHDGFCPVCQFAAALHVAVPAPAAIAVPLPRVVVVAAVSINPAAPLRGPPALRPRSRSPPVFS